MKTKYENGLDIVRPSSLEIAAAFCGSEPNRRSYR